MSPESDPIDQIREVKKNCLELLLKIADLCPVDASGHRPEAFRLIATPMLYAVWERCFTLCQSISLRMIRLKVLLAKYEFSLSFKCLT